MRRAARIDAEAIADLDRLLFPDNCFNEFTIARELMTGMGLVIYEGSQLLGYALARIDYDILDIIRIGVEPFHQCQGHGTRMLQHMLEVQPKTMLCVQKDNEPALLLYLKLNFHIVGQLSRSWVMVRATSSC